MPPVNKKNQNTPIPEARINYFDKTAFDLLNSLSIMKVDRNAEVDSDSAIGSINERHAIEISLGGKFVEENGVAIYAYENLEKIGFNETNGPAFFKFIDNIYQTSQINKIASKKFVQELTFDWLITTKRNGKADTNFSVHLLSSIDDSIEELKVFYFIPHLMLAKPFALGSCELGYFTRSYFIERSYEDLSEEYSGKVFISTVVKAEIERAKEIALQKCSLAMDVLKICSVTLVIPSFESSFEIDLRLSRNIDNEIFVEHLREKPSISRTKFGSGRPFVMDSHQMKGFEERSINLFAKFLNDVEYSTSELQKIIVSAIHQFSLALSNVDLHQRIALLFSIMEALLLKDDNGNISETVCKYLCRLIYKTRGDRESMIALYKKMYKTRSSWVHHAKRVEIEEADLSFLQYCVHRLLIVLIKATDQHTSKETILVEIDNTILSS